MSTYSDFRDAGWNASLAEAFVGTDYTVEQAAVLSPEEAFTLFLEWNGIIGYGEMIRDALDNCRNMEAEDA